MPPELRLATARRLVRERVPFAIPAFRAAMTVARFLTGGPRRLASEARQVAAHHGLAGAAEHLAAQALVECQRFPPLERDFLGDALLPSGSAATSSRLADRLRRRFARTGLDVLDLRFERAYQRLLADPRRPLLPASAFEAGGLLTMIGSLAPGGAERQLVSLLGGLAPRESRDLQVVGLFFDAPIKHFFRPQVDESRVRIAEILRPPEFAEALLAEYPGDRAIAQFVAAQATPMPWELVEIWCYLLEMLERRPAVFHGWMDDCNVKGGIAAAIAGVPRIVLGTRSLAPDNFVLFQPFMRAAYRALLRLPQVTILNNSEAGARDYERWLEAPPGTIKVVHNGFDFAPFDAVDRTGARSRNRSRLGLPADACVVGTVIRFTEEKQPFVWLEAAAAVAAKHPDTRFVMLGDGPLREPVARRAAALGLGERLLLPGYSHDVLGTLPALNLFLLTSRVEGLPNVLIEAQAMGVPVVAPDVGGAAATFRAGESGWLVTQNDARGFAQVLDSALSDRAALRAAGRRADEFVRQAFGVERMVAETRVQYGWPAQPDAPEAETRALAARCAEALASFWASQLTAQPLTAIVDLGRRPLVPDAWQALLADDRVASLIFVHEQLDDAGFVQDDRQGFVSYVTGADRLPDRLGRTAVSLFGPRAFEPWLLGQLASASAAASVESFAFQGSRSEWLCRSFAEIRTTAGCHSRRPGLSLAAKREAARRARLERSRHFTQFWPPHRCAETAGDLRRARLQALAGRYARLIEQQDGRPLAEALTTAPVRPGAVRSDGPIVVACASLDPGGAERQAALTARGLHERGWPVTFVAWNEGNVATQHYGPLLVDAGVPILNIAREVAYPGPDAPPLLDQTETGVRLVLAARGAAIRAGYGPTVLRFFNVFDRLRPRVVHAWLDATNVLAGLAALWAGVPRVVLGLRNVSPPRQPLYQPWFRPLYELLLRDPRTSLVANSHAGARDYAAWLGIDEGRIRVVENAFDPTLHDVGEAEPVAAADFSPQPAAGPLVLGTFRFYFEKDPLLFVRAVAEIAREIPDARFRLVGRGPLEAEVRAEIVRLSLDDRLELVGPRKNVLAEMRQASLLLHTARVEGLPNVLLEAQAAGLPVLTTDAGGAREAVEPGSTAVVVESRDPGALAREAVRLLRSPQWLAAARERGPAFVRERFAPATMLDRTVELYGLEPVVPAPKEASPMRTADPAAAPTALVWTPERVAEFWDGMARAGLGEAQAFGRLAKHCIHWLVSRHLTPGGRHLDYGAGGGDIAAHLIEQGFPFAVWEPSQERTRFSESRLAGRPGFLGSPGPDAVEGFDAVTCFEVLEHVLDDAFEKVCDELASYVRPGGTLVVSTPNNEDLSKDTVYCPVSNHTFHRWQHVRRIDAAFLEWTFARRGFRKVCTHQLDFDENLFRPWLHMLGFAPAPAPAPGRPEIVPLHIHQVLNHIDSVMGGASRLLHVAVKEPRQR